MLNKLIGDRQLYKIQMDYEGKTIQPDFLDGFEYYHNIIQRKTLAARLAAQEIIQGGVLYGLER